MPEAREILCIGATTEDTIYKVDSLPITTGKILSHHCMRFASGMATSAAIAIVKLGGRAALFGSIGADPLGQSVKRDVGALGVDTSFMREVPEARTATAAIFVAPGGDVAIVAHYDSALTSPPGALPPISKGRFACVLADVRWPAAAGAALAAAAQAGIPGILDLDTGPRETLEMLLPLASHVVASAAAAALVSGEADPAAALLGLSRFNPGFVCVTDGARGCHWRMHATAAPLHLPAPHVQAASTLGAGDAFHGAFALRLAEGASLA